MHEGEKKNKLTLVENIGYGNGRFLCECGVEKIIPIQKVSTEKVKSCGNHKTKKLKKEIRKEKRDRRTYYSWQHMRDRCLNQNSDSYKHYGGRGITICEEWEDYNNFLRDMGNRPNGTTIDRVDNNLGYCKENCRWADKTIQQNNRRNNLTVTLGGETHTLKEWSKRIGVKYSTIRNRVKRGWTEPSDILSTENRAKHLLEYGGKTMDMREWAEYLGKKVGTLRAQLCRGYPPEIIFSKERKIRSDKKH